MRPGALKSARPIKIVGTPCPALFAALVGQHRIYVRKQLRRINNLLAEGRNRAALNRERQPTSKRLATNTASLAVKPERLAERIEEALAETDPHRSLLAMSELQFDTVNLAPDGPNVVRARRWLADAIELLREATTR